MPPRRPHRNEGFRDQVLDNDLAPGSFDGAPVPTPASEYPSFDNPPDILPDDRLAHQVAVDSYFDPSGQPVDFNQASEQIRHNAAEAIDYHINAAFLAQDDSADVAYQNRTPELPGSDNPQSNETLQQALDPMPAFEAPTPKPPLEKHEIEAFDSFIGNVMSAADLRAGHARYDREVGHGSNTADLFWTDGQMKERTVRKEAESPGARPGLFVESYRQAGRRDGLVSQLAHYMTQNPQYGELVAARFAVLEANSIASGQKTAKKEAAVSDSEDRLHGAEQLAARPDRPLEGYPLNPNHDPDDADNQAALEDARRNGDAAMIDKYTDHTGQYAKDKKRYGNWRHNMPSVPVLGSFRIMGASQAKRNALAEARAEHAAHNQEIASRPYKVAIASLSLETTAKPAAETARHLQDESDFRLSCLQEVYALALEQTRARTPQELKDRHDSSGSLSDQANESVIQMWNSYRSEDTYTLEDEHAVFANLSTMFDYLRDIDKAISATSSGKRAAHELLTLRATVLEDYIETRYRSEQLRIVNAATDTGGFAGRYPAYYMSDGGIWLDDGSNARLYPDGSYAIAGPDAFILDRRNADGTIWNAAEASSKETYFIPPEEDDLNTMTQSELHDAFDTALKSWFINQGSSDREAARRIAQVGLTQAEGRISSNPGNTADQVEMSQYSYWSSYLGVTPGTVPRYYEAHITLDGSVRTTLTNYTSQSGEVYTGAWIIHPDGSKENVKINKFGQPQSVRHFNADGTEL